MLGEYSNAKRGLLSAALVVCFCLTGTFFVAAQQMESHQHHQAGADPASAKTEAKPISGLSIPDSPLVDQSGRKVAFYSDLIKGQVVAINFIFTTCPTICNPLGATFGRLQKLLNERKDSGINLISVTVDPATDTPEVLRAWSAQFHAEAGWTLLTGEPSTVISLLKALQVYTPDKESHSPIILVGNDTSKKWIRANGLAPAAKLASIIREIAGARPDNPSADGRTSK